MVSKFRNYIFLKSREKWGGRLRLNYNPPKNEKYKQPQCTPEKEAAEKKHEAKEKHHNKSHGQEL